MLTTTEAAALLNERGYAKPTHKRGAVTADAVKHMCARGVFPGAQLVKRGPGRGYWLIPVADIEALLTTHHSRLTTPSQS